MVNDLQAHLVQQIRQNGPMALGEFINTSMTHPTLGYYASESVYPIGKKGDFITAPEVSQMFGEMIGVWVIDTWEQMGGGEITLIECGPGRGTLMADILRVAQKKPEFISSVHLQLVETSTALIEVQKRTIKKYIGLERVLWRTSVLEQKSRCIIVGNEFLDALPIEQVILREGAWYQRTIELASGQDDEALCFGEKSMDEALVPFLPLHAQENEIYEVSPVRTRFIGKCIRTIKERGGSALFIDYGHEETHFGDTLQAVKKHEYAGLLSNIGKTDITSHIDFESIGRIVKDNNIQCEPVMTQGSFLKNLGIEHRASALKVVEKEKSKDIDVALNRLIGHKQMGELFKVFCFHSNKNEIVLKPAGF